MVNMGNDGKVSDFVRSKLGKVYFGKVYMHITHSICGYKRGCELVFVSLGYCGKFVKCGARNLF